MFDTHSHIQFKVFDKNRDEVIERARKAGVEKIIAVGTDLISSREAVEVAKKYPEVFASVGIHPHHVFKYCHPEQSEGSMDSIKQIPRQARNDITRLEELLVNPKVVAIGETGMDKHLYKKTKYSNYQVSKQFIKLQKEMFRQQIGLAIKYNKSLVIHNREAVKETLEVLEKNWDKKLEGHFVFHFCEPDARLLNFAKSHNIFIGIDTDVLTDKTKQDFVKQIPVELLVLETDSPFISSESKDISEILNFVSKLFNKDLEDLIYKNSKLLFKL